VSDSIVISIDAMGGDHGPAVAVPGVALALERIGADSGRARFLLFGDEAAINAELARHPKAKAACEVRACDKVIASDEKPSQALRRGKGSTLWNAVEAVKDGEAHAAVSGGNTGALMAISKLVLRMTGGIQRPAIVASWPTMRGWTAVLDVGANIESDADQLVEFAVMGEAFHCAVYGSKRPSVGLLNVGSEDQKGHEEVREAHRLLQESGLDIDYRGFVEGDDIAKGTVDVVVTDGFTGNVALKTAEGLARYVRQVLRDAFTSSWRAKLGAMIAGPALRQIRNRLDPSSVNGGPLLGLNGLVIKSHGGADAKGFANAIKIAYDLAASGYAAQIDRNLKHLAATLPGGGPAEGPASAPEETQ
jgi:glycerol-3-phosphate acyltransferase PlsX